MRPRCPAPPQMEIMGPHAPYEARRVVLMAGYGTLDPLGAHARARMARGGIDLTGAGCIGSLDALPGARLPAVLQKVRIAGARTHTALIKPSYTPLYSILLSLSG